MIDKLKIYGDHGLLREGCGVDVSQEDLGYLKSWLRPHHIEVGTELNAVFLNKISIFEFLVSGESEKALRKGIREYQAFLFDCKRVVPTLFLINKS